MNQITINGLKRISKAAAIRRFNEGKPFIMCPVKIGPGGMWGMGCYISSDSIQERKERASWYGPNGKLPNQFLWKGDTNTTGWFLLYREWTFYNASKEAGTYAAYYVEIDVANSDTPNG